MNEEVKYDDCFVVAGGERAKKVQGQGGAVGGEGRDRVHVVADHGTDPAALGWALLSSKQVRSSRVSDEVVHRGALSSQPKANRNQIYIPSMPR